MEKRTEKRREKGNKKDLLRHQPHRTKKEMGKKVRGPTPRVMKMMGPYGPNLKGKKGSRKGDKTAEANPAASKRDGQVKKLDTSTAENLLTEVSTLVTLIKTEATKETGQVKVVSVKGLEHDPDGAVLLDSGATHCLRQPMSEKELELAVGYASGKRWKVGKECG